MDQTSLEFLYPLPSYLVVNHQNDISNAANDLMVCNSHCERNINEMSLHVENIEKGNNVSTIYNDDLNSNQKEDQNESSQLLKCCNSCDRTFKTSKIEEDGCLKENRFTSTTFFF